MSVKDQGRHTLRGTSRCAQMRSSTRRRLWRDAVSDLQASEHPYVADDSAEDDLKCWKLEYNTALLKIKIEEDEVRVKRAPGYEEIDNDKAQGAGMARSRNT